jgi:alanine-glyoxylate transaminase/serine-glyoxylate transaminase/serine-pyruvate transaminase
LNVSLGQILEEGLETRFARHRKLGQACQAAITAVGLSQVPLSQERAAFTLTAPYYPESVTSQDLLPKVRAAGAILAGGLHPQIKARYFRIGHMGATKPGDLLATIGAIEAGLLGCGYRFEPGAGVAAAQRVLQA